MSKGVLLAVGAVAAGAAVLFMGGGTAHAAQPNALPAAGGTPGPIPPPEVINEIGQALSTADPATIRRTADDVEHKGFPVQASDMRAVATALENASHAAVVSTPVPGLTAPLPPLPLVPPIPTTAAPPSPGLGLPGGIASPGIIPPGLLSPTLQGGPPPIATSQGSAPTPLGLAQQLALNIANNVRGGENKDLVTAFQLQEQSRGHYSGKIDGLYGPSAALALAQDFGIVPPKPMYFAKNPTPGKQAYTKALLAMAQADPARAQEWIKASDVRNI